MLEVEIKADLENVNIEQLQAAATEMGFMKAATLEETDVYFNGNDRDFMKTDEALRLRSYKDLDLNVDETVITYKGPKSDDRSNTRLEYETSVGNLSVMGDLLMALGYQAAFTVEKTREEWVMVGRDETPDITLCLDTVKNLGNYMELETLVTDESQKQAMVDRLLELLDRFGVSRENLTRKSYLELLYSA